MYPNRPEGMHNKYKQEIGSITNPVHLKGSLEDALVGADVFIGVSGRPNILDGRMVQTMSNDPIIFALTNPEPEIFPSQALASGAKVVATGRSDFPNQINNVSVFPSMLRVLLDLRVRTLSEDLLVAIATGHCRSGRTRAFARRLYSATHRRPADSCDRFRKIERSYQASC